MRRPIKFAAKFAAALGAVFLASVGIAACGGGIPANAVVQVNGNAITKSTFRHWAAIVASSTTSSTTKTSTKPVVPEPPEYKACIAHLEAAETKSTKESKSALKSECETQYKEVKDGALGFLISAQWLLGQAEEMKIVASNKEVEKKFDAAKKEEFPKEAEFKKFLASSGYTVSDLLLSVKVRDVLEPKVEAKVIKGAKKPTKAEIAKYYKAHESTYGTPERRNLNIILTKTEAQAKSAKSEIEGGKSFASVAKAVSIESVSKAKGGALPDVEKGQETKALSEVVFAAKPNVLTGPVKTEFGYYVFEVKKTLKATKESLKSVESQIKDTLTSEREDKALEKFEKSYKKRWQARTECRAGFVVEDCKGYKAPKTTATTPPTTSSTATTSTSTTASSSSSSK